MSPFSVDWERNSKRGEIHSHRYLQRDWGTNKILMAHFSTVTQKRGTLGGTDCQEKQRGRIGSCSTVEGCLLLKNLKEGLRTCKNEAGSLREGTELVSLYLSRDK